MKKNKLLSLSLLIVLMGGCWAYGCRSDATTDHLDDSPSRPEPPYDWADPGLALRLQDALEGWAEYFGFHGASAVVRTPGWLDWSGSTGMIDIQAGEPYETDAPCRIASITKPFTSTVILQLVDEGLLALDNTTLAELVPGYPNGEDITVEHLLRHRSGIPEIHSVDAVFLAALVLRPERWVSPGEVLEWTYLPIPIYHLRWRTFLPREPLAMPGGNFHYSQSNYVALGIIIEEVTGKALADVFDERIFEPLGMTGAYLPRRGDPFDLWGYTNLLGLLNQKFPSKYLWRSENWLNSAGWSSAAIVTTASELVVFLSGLLEGRLLSREGLSNATDWMEIEPGDIVTEGEHGMGLFRHRYDGFCTVGHTGSLPGSLSLMQYIPELDVYIGAGTNNDRVRGGGPGLVERIRWALLNEYPG